MLAMTNPQNVAYWAAIGSALAALGVDEPTLADYAAYFSGFMLLSVVWAFVFAALVERVLAGVGVRYARITYLACALAFLALALLSLRDLLLSTREIRGDVRADALAYVLAYGCLIEKREKAPPFDDAAACELARECDVLLTPRDIFRNGEIVRVET